MRPLLKCALAGLSLAVLAACSDSSDSPANNPLLVYADPGTGPWELVAQDALIDECGLDPAVLAQIDAQATYSYAVVRYGKLCHEFYHPNDPGRDELANNFSSTKTLGAVTFGRVVLLSESLPQPLSDTDRMDAWVEDITFNPDALVAHVLAMIGFNENLDYGQRSFSYDASGLREINRLSDVVEAVIAQDPAQFGDVTTTGEFARLQIFDNLGMNNSKWNGKSFATNWRSNLRDMARLGLLLIHDGVWNGERLVNSDWVYKITHPAFEDTNTGFGYLTWVSASTNYYVPSLEFPLPAPLGKCDPFALWREYPHGLSDSPDCNYGGEYSCLQDYDVGSFAALGAGGQNIVGHRALELVVVTRNAGSGTFINEGWDLVRPALVAVDPNYAGDEEAFCSAYSAGEYAPDLIVAP